jgi:hypothetical protein
MEPAVAPAHVEGQPRAWLCAEGMVALAVAATLYSLSDSSWLIFAVLFFTPDVSFLGYVAGPRIGSYTYNAVHSYVGPLAACLVLVLAQAPVGLPLIWLAHIGLDRALGYGLKYPTAFQDTHLGRIGGRRK